MPDFWLIQIFLLLVGIIYASRGIVAMKKGAFPWHFVPAMVLILWGGFPFFVIGWPWTLSIFIIPILWILIKKVRSSNV